MNSTEYERFKTDVLGIGTTQNALPPKKHNQDPEIDPFTLREANDRHDREHGDPYEWQVGWRQK